MITSLRKERAGCLVVSTICRFTFCYSCVHDLSFHIFLLLCPRFVVSHFATLVSTICRFTFCYSCVHNLSFHILLLLCPQFVVSHFATLVSTICRFTFCYSSSRCQIRLRHSLEIFSLFSHTTVFVFDCSFNLSYRCLIFQKYILLDLLYVSS